MKKPKPKSKPQPKAELDITKLCRFPPAPPNAKPVILERLLSYAEEWEKLYPGTKLKYDKNEYTAAELAEQARNNTPLGQQLFDEIFLHLGVWYNLPYDLSKSSSDLEQQILNTVGWKPAEEIVFIGPISGTKIVKWVGGRKEKPPYYKKSVDKAIYTVLDSMFYDYGTRVPSTSNSPPSA